ncbi:unnamed protein product [Nesidiocoris tenuis]|uniref:THAP-type domain-containing protein n=1 Tax=Nesidiocoris tenuis TaxID=355587 RepID=A0A6H5G533_9HEMI|nr:unnamed protein product [Nesidiocoris tenuis]CAA9997875.1 unnamed protein product [Nesidiocoris tenuis]
MVLGSDSPTSAPVYLIDYGLVSRYRNKNGSHEEFRQDPRVANAGTAAFSSRDSHKGVICRRSDLESLGYCLVSWLGGTLPWEDSLASLPLVEQQKDDAMADIRGFLARAFSSRPPSSVLYDYFAYVVSMDFDSKPNYKYIKELLQSGIIRAGFRCDRKVTFDSHAKLDRKSLKAGGPNPFLEGSRAHPGLLPLLHEKPTPGKGCLLLIYLKSIQDVCVWTITTSFLHPEQHHSGGKNGFRFSCMFLIRLENPYISQEILSKGRITRQIDPHPTPQTVCTDRFFGNSSVEESFHTGAMESSNPENQGMAERHDASSTVKTTSEGDFEEVDDVEVGTKGESDSTAPMDVTSEWTHLASDTAELERGEESLEAGDNGNLQEGADDGTESSPKASVPAGQIESLAEDTSSPVPTSGNLLEDVEGSMSKSPEADDTREGEIEATSVKRTDDDVAGAGLEHKMEAMFGDESSSDDVKTADKPSADELKEVDSSKQSKTAEAIVDDSQPDEGEDRSKHEDDEMEGEKDEKSKLNQTPDESNLEFMMEALHADKLSATEPSILKQSDTPGMELKDVLQALTGDHDADESVQHSSDSKTKNSKKAAGKTKKSSDQSHDSDANNSSSEQPKKKLSAASTSKRVLRNTRSQSIEQASSDESDDETTEKELRSKIKREKDDSEDEDDSQPGNRSSRSRSKLKSAAGKASKGNAKKLDPDLISKSNKVCILPHCRQRCYPQLGISLHRFPFANNPMRNIWLKLVEQRPPGPITAYICSKHFTNDDYYNDSEL